MKVPFLKLRLLPVFLTIDLVLSVRCLYISNTQILQYGMLLL